MMKEMMRKKGADIIRKKLGEYVSALKTGKLGDYFAALKTGGLGSCHVVHQRVLAISHFEFFF